jgi:hypothetical protein
MKKYVSMMLCLVMLTGCSIFGQAVEKIADGVEAYCAQPYVYRNEFRNTVNAHLGGTGHEVHVHCAGDPEPEVTHLMEHTQWHTKNQHVSNLPHLPKDAQSCAENDVNGNTVGQEWPHFNCKEVSRKTQEERPCQEQDMQLTQQSPLQAQLLLLQPRPEPSPLQVLVQPI